MAERFGSVVVCGDYVGDVKAITKALNSLMWACDGSRGVFLSHKKSIFIDVNDILEVSVFPQRFFCTGKDGRRYYENETKPSLIRKLDEEEGCDWEFELCSLEYLSKLISPKLKSGTIELVAVGNARCFEAFYQRLIINADGKAEKHWLSHNSDSTESWCESGSEQYDPSAMKVAA